MARPAAESVEVTQAGARWRGNIRRNRRAWVPKAAAASSSPRELVSSQPPELAPSPQRPADAAGDGGEASTPPPVSEGLSSESRNLLDVLRSFYEDMLEPLDHHVVRELETRTGRRSSLGELRRLAEITPGIEVVEDHHDPKRNWLYLEGLPREFVDQRSLEDNYPSDLWPRLAELVDRHASDTWGKSRFDCAKLLRSRMPALLSSYPLGKVCHIVQLAVRLHRIFGYRNGWIVHYEKSLDCEKTFQAEKLEGDRRHHLPVLTWEQFTQGLQELLNSPKHPHGLALSAMKAIFRTQYGVELTETALGYPKLSAVFEDARLASICRIESRGSEKFVRRAGDAAGSPDTWNAGQLRNARGAGMSYAAYERGGGRARAEASSSAEARPVAAEVPMPMAITTRNLAWSADAEARAAAAAAAAAGEVYTAAWPAVAAGQPYPVQFDAAGNAYYSMQPQEGIMQQQDHPGFVRMVFDGQVRWVRPQDPQLVVRSTFLEVYETQPEQPRLNRARSAPSRQPLLDP